MQKVATEIPREICVQIFRLYTAPHSTDVVELSTSPFVPDDVRRVYLHPPPPDLKLYPELQGVISDAYTDVVSAVRLTVQTSDPSLLPSCVVPLLALDETIKTEIERNFPKILLAELSICEEGSADSAKLQKQNCLITTDCLRQYLLRLAVHQAPSLPPDPRLDDLDPPYDVPNVAFRVSVDMLKGLLHIKHAFGKERQVYSALSILHHPRNVLVVIRAYSTKEAEKALRDMRRPMASIEAWMETRMRYVAEFQVMLRRQWLVDCGRSVGCRHDSFFQRDPICPAQFERLAEACVDLAMAASSMKTLSRKLDLRIGVYALTSVHNLSVLSFYHRTGLQPWWPYREDCDAQPCVCCLIARNDSLQRSDFDHSQPPQLIRCHIEPGAWLAMRHLYIIRHTLGDGTGLDVEMTLGEMTATAARMASLVPNQQPSNHEHALLVSYIRHDVRTLDTVCRQWRASGKQHETMRDGNIPFETAPVEADDTYPDGIILKRLSLAFNPHLLDVNADGVIVLCMPEGAVQGVLLLEHFGV